MKTKIELDAVFESPDDPELVKSTNKLLIAIPIIWIALLSMVLLCIRYADAIDSFFASILKSLFNL